MKKTLSILILCTIPALALAAGEHSGGHGEPGETLRFVVRNTGKLPHEMVIGSMKELQEHAQMMRGMPDMKHAEPNQITLGPGQRGGLVWQFDMAGTVDFACLIPGHLEAGMAGKVQVE